jgi:hypothetical protein
MATGRQQVLLESCNNNKTKEKTFNDMATCGSVCLRWLIPMPQNGRTSCIMNTP